ncbi:exopolyphosphatase [Ligilactobacillus sp. Marseille-Q7487]|uniref:exopolyphosphatase n=1 Tax=Ligilactobacillus sp. Marseille-Q7487 TaxID=3022128 RepID=UPI0024A8345D|nr:exopolyphosphatase [Ligilactobacillus sp. Marseille-Q7487]
MSKNLFGIIYMSSLKVKLTIFDLKNMNILEEVDSAEFIPHNSQTNIYTQELSKITLALNGFKQLLKDYHVQSFRFFGNKQLLDDVSARYIADQIFVRTNLKISWLNTGQVNFFKAQAVIGQLQALNDTTYETTYLLSLGSNFITIFEFHDNKFKTVWNIEFGQHELNDIQQALRLTANDSTEVINDYIKSKLESLKNIFPKTNGKVRLVLQHSVALRNKFIKSTETTAEISIGEFQKIYHDIINNTDQYLTNSFAIDDNRLSRVIPHFLIVNRIIKLLKVDTLMLTTLSVTEGLALQQAIDNGFVTADFSEMILTSAQNIANRYLTDNRHRMNVKKFALHLFDQLKRLHHLTTRHRLLLQIACEVDDIGNFINPKGHYRHSAYILEANKIIGLSDNENQIIAEISRYHSSESPEIDQHHYQHLDDDIQMIVAKLAAILRIADALDDSHNQKIKKISISLKEEQLIISAFCNQDLTLEKWSFTQKAPLFKEVFGIEPVFKQRRVRN